MRTLFLAALLTSACSPRERGPASLPPGDYEPRAEDDELPLPRERAAGLRNDAFARAGVWRQPAAPVSSVDFRANPPGEDAFPPDAVRCVPPEASRAPDAEVHRVPPDAGIKVKYGRRNPEVVAEVAAARLLRALGFGADRMWGPRRAGCPPYPQPYFMARQLLQPRGPLRRHRAGVDRAALSGQEDASPGADGWLLYGWSTSTRRGAGPPGRRSTLCLIVVSLAGGTTRPPTAARCPPAATIPPADAARRSPSVDGATSGRWP
jgi:hypothetical protein